MDNRPLLRQQIFGEKRWSRQQPIATRQNMYQLDFHGPRWRADPIFRAR